jgi:hypothetical protein
MRVGDVRQASPGTAAVPGGEPASAPAEGRALIALTPVAPAATVPTGTRQAPFQTPFLAHLLAVKDQHAQTRDKRRAAPHEALTAYRATASLVR